MFFSYKVEGRENLPKKTNFIVVANHTSFMDPVAVGVAVPQKIYWLAARELYKISWLSWFLQAVETLPVGSASSKGLEILLKNQNLGLFPEGTCSRDGELREFRRGAALLAFKTGRPIVPCAVLGAYKALPVTARFPRIFNPVRVKIGKPIYLLKEFEEVISDIRLQEGVFKIKSAIKEMLNAG